MGCLLVPLVLALGPGDDLLTGADAFVEDVEVLHEFHGEVAGEQYGCVARVIGDADEDGALDFVTSAPTRPIDGAVCGHVDAFSGRTGERLWQRDGEPGERLGNGVAPAGDVDGDGLPDVIVGAPGGAGGRGRAYVLSGADGAELLVLEGQEAGRSFGLKVCGVADLDGDGLAELAVGAPAIGGPATAKGTVTIFSGDDGHALYRLEGTAAGEQFGSAVDAERAGARPLLVVGAMGHAGGGRAYVFRLGAEGAEPAFTIDPDATAANLGQYFVSLPGDLDGDGVGDVYASDWNNGGAGRQCGRVYVHSGATGRRLLTIDGHRPGEGFGTSPSVAGDVDRDGVPDLIVGAWQSGGAAPSGGACYLHSGKDGALLRTLTSKQPGDTLGFDAVGIGDVNGDGRVDFLLTAGWSPVHGARTGRVFIVAGTLPADGAR